jgi:hypothetical protein
MSSTELEILLHLRLMLDGLMKRRSVLDDAHRIAGEVSLT